MLIAMDREEAIAELRRVKRLRERANAAQEAATKATDPAIVAALKVGLRPVEIVTECGVSDSYVRGVRRANKIPPNPSYANLKPPNRAKADSTEATAPSYEPEPTAAPSPSQRPQADRIHSLDRARAASLAQRAANATDDSWAERSTAGRHFSYEVERFRFLVGVALDEGLLQDSDLPD